MSAYALAAPELRRARAEEPSLLRRLRRAWRPWLPLSLALALAAMGVLALGATAWRYVGGDASSAGSTAGTTPAVHVHDQAAPVPAAGVMSVRAITESLTRSTRGAAGQTLDVVFAPPEYLHSTGQHDAAGRYDAERFLLFFVTEELHAGELPPPLRPVLFVAGRAVLAEPPTVLMDAVHHRATVLRFAGAGQAPLATQAAPTEAGALELHFAAGEAVGGALRWELPIVLPRSPAAPLAGVGAIGTILALLGGLLAAMWPCLFQLTAFFIPSLAGLSMTDAEARPTRTVRAQVLRTALLFVSGIVLVYTLAGAAAGYVVQTPGARELFASWQRPLTTAAALVIGAMAIRMAVRARAPMACHMPMFSPVERLGKSPAGTMLLGVAFATGCMTCFGAAITLALLTYVASTGSVLLGAATLFVFSLGFAVPLVLGSLLMARVLPLLDRLQRFVPALTLASSAVMFGFAVLLLTDRYHVVSDAFVRLAAGT